MSKRRVEGYVQNQRRNGDLACKRSRPERRWKHLYLVLDDWEKGYSIHKIDLASFDSDSDDNQDSSRVDDAEHLLEPPLLRLESPRDVDMLFAAMGNKIFIVTDARYGKTSGLIYDTDTAALALGPSIPAHLQCGFDTIVAAHGMVYAFSPPPCKGERSLDEEQQQSFDVMSCALTGSRGPAELGWFWRSLPALPPPFSARETITAYAVHSDGDTIFMTTAYRDRPGLQKGTYSFNTKYSVWKRHSWALPFRDEGYFDSELDAWVGLRWDGYICCCQLPNGSETPTEDDGGETPTELGPVELDWQLVEDKLFCRKTERHLRASLTYMGRSKFCLVRSAMRDEGAKDKYLLGDDDDDDDSCVLHLTMFGLKYNNKGELRFTNDKTEVSYRVARHTNFFSPIAFWL